MDESTWTWLVIGAIAAVVLVYRTISRSLERRRRAWVDTLAAEFGTSAAHGPDATSLFDVNVNGRRCEIAQGYRSRTTDGRSIRGYGLIVTVPLRGVSEIYVLSFKRRDGSLSIGSSGYQPREGWVTAAVREAIFAFFDNAGAREPLNLEGGALVYVTHRRITGSALREIVERQVIAGARIESAL